jgi:putative ABC transport system permease protein
VSTTQPRGTTWLLWLRLAGSQLRERPGQIALIVLAIALGVALGAAVYFVNSAALNEFSLATRRLVGEADLIVQAAPEGFDERLFGALARDPAVSTASPVLSQTLALDEPLVTAPRAAGQSATLELLALDPFRASALQPMLMAAIGGELMRLLAPDAVILSSAAAEALHLHAGEQLRVMSASGPRALRIIALLPAEAYAQPLALMDIASAQALFGALGRINRIDLRLRPGIDVERFRSELAAQLPPGVVALRPQLQRERAVAATRAYRVNLNMLALVALMTGAFLVFSIQWLSVLRRRGQLALLRALGVTRGELQGALLLEGALIGAAGSLLGVFTAGLVAAFALRRLEADVGGPLSAITSARFAAEPLPMLLFFALGTLTACIGAWAPAREAAQRAPARALKAGDAQDAVRHISTTPAALLLIGGGALLAYLPPIAGLPVLGYVAVAALLLGSVLLAPPLMRLLLARVPRMQRVVFDTALAELRGNVGLSAVSLASIIVSFSLMVAMAIMVHSFRVSFDAWLARMLPADLELRVAAAGNGTSWSADAQQRIAALPGVARTTFQRWRQIYLRPEQPPITLIAREGTAQTIQATLPLVGNAALPATAPPYAWISEPVEDMYGYRRGDVLRLPLDGHVQSFVVAGVWRDYARPGGAVVIERSRYVALSADRSASAGSIWLRDGADLERVEAAIEAQFAHGEAPQMMATPALRERSLMIFDRAFAITYALEAIAVAIGLVGVGMTSSSRALARRAQFGMLRHIGMRRRELLGMLASEGFFLSGLGVAYGLALGSVLSLVLIYVINRQSFHWSIDLIVPWWQLIMLALALMAASVTTAALSGRAVMGADVIRAVREDW